MGNVATARRFVQSTFADVVPNDVAADLVLATSELVTNAFEHGRSSAVLVTASTAGGRASVTVSSRSEPGAVAPVDQWTRPAPERLSGRGLGIVHEVADAVDVRRDGDTLAITVHRDL